MRGIDPVRDNGEAVVRYNPDLRFTHSRVSVVSCHFVALQIVFVEASKDAERNPAAPSSCGAAAACCLGNGGKWL